MSAAYFWDGFVGHARSDRGNGLNEDEVDAFCGTKLTLEVAGVYICINLYLDGQKTSVSELRMHF